MRYLFVMIGIFAMVLLTACGKEKEEDNTYIDVSTRTLPVSVQDGQIDLGLQFFQGKPAMIYLNEDGSLFYATEEENTQLNNEQLEILDAMSKGWRFDEAYLYQWETGGTVLIIEDRTSGAQKEYDAGGIIQDCLRIGDILCISVSQSMGSGQFITYDLVENRQISKTELSSFYYQLDTNAEGVLYALDSKGIGEVDVSNGKIEYLMQWEEMAFTQADSIVGMNVLSKMQVQLLTAQNAFFTLSRLEKVEGDRITLSYRTVSVSEEMERAVVAFNKSSKEYYVEVEQAAEGEYTMETGNRTMLEISAGYGPDIIDSKLMRGIGSAYLNRDMLVDLTPYLNEVDAEEYIDSYVDQWNFGDGIYGVGVELYFNSVYYLPVEYEAQMKDWTYDSWKSLLESVDEDICMHIRWGGARGYLRDIISKDVLIDRFVDWESNQCDYETQEFYDVLEFVEKYSYDKTKPRDGLAIETGWLGYAMFSAAVTTCDAMGYVPMFLRDDAEKKPVIEYDLLAINRNSKNQDGAWEFIQFVLSEEGQRAMYEGYYMNGYPVHKDYFHELTQDSVEREWTYMRAESYVNGFVMETEYLTQEQADLLEEYVEAATCIKENRNPDICDIIYEEAEDYFDGVKSVEEVAAIIQNRVQLYLNEHA